MAYCNNLKNKTIDANDIARFPTAVGWISVKDRLPERKWIDCLVATKLCDGSKGTNIAWLNDDNGNWKSRVDM